MCRFSVICILLFYNSLVYASETDETYRRGLQFKQQALALVVPQAFKEDENDSKKYKSLFLSISHLSAEKKKDFANLLQHSFNAFHTFARYNQDHPHGWYQCGYISCLGGDIERTNLYLAHLRTLAEKPSCDALLTRLETMKSVRVFLMSGQHAQQTSEDNLFNKLSWTAAIILSTWGSDFIMQTLKQTIPTLLDPSYTPNMNYFDVPDLHIFEPLVVMLSTKFLVKSSLRFSVTTYRDCKKTCKKKPKRSHET
jgi:hypothetical protein